MGLDNNNKTETLIKKHTKTNNQLAKLKIIKRKKLTQVTSMQANSLLPIRLMYHLDYSYTNLLLVLDFNLSFKLKPDNNEINNSLFKLNINQPPLLAEEIITIEKPGLREVKSPLLSLSCFLPLLLLLDNNLILNKGALFILFKSAMLLFIN